MRTLPQRTPRKVYEEVKDFESLQTTVEEYLGEFNAESKQPMHLVMFGDAIDHVSRISRVIRWEFFSVSKFSTLVCTLP